MLTRDDIAPNIYLRQTSGDGKGLIAVVQRVGTSWSGEWFFQLRYVSQPDGTRKSARSQWTVNLREDVLVHFELVGTWISAEALEGVSPLSDKSKKARSPYWMREKERPSQLRLFEDE